MGRLTPEESAAGIAALLPEQRAEIEALLECTLKYSNERAVHFAQLCHQFQWSTQWAEYVWDLMHPMIRATPGGVAFDDDIPF